MCIRTGNSPLLPKSTLQASHDYRQQLDSLLYGRSVNCIPHEQIIAKLDQSAQVFRILIVKTDMTIPYTSIFFELDCGYWDAEAEQRLRQSILVSELK